MFDIGWSELLVIGVVALVVIGPKELPGVVRTIAQNIGKLRRLASDFQGQFNDAIREMELADLKKDAEKLISDATSAASFDDQVKKIGDEIK
ncbi:MAG TPA: Sec-independent protein translocase protein TatB, partial [Xanthobacteraceae bacterium]|nr:Sec-independent protein translocase protein TatB [Xanthobacteraceae bacterium]